MSQASRPEAIELRCAMFDPYHKWLGILPKDCPPNHYRLLGVEVFESDLDVIEAAAEQRMAFVRQHQSGQQAIAAARILNELASARLCLLKSDAKSAYDAQLRGNLAQSERELAGYPRPRALKRSTRMARMKRRQIIIRFSLFLAIFVAAGVSLKGLFSVDSLTAPPTSTNAVLKSSTIPPAVEHGVPKASLATSLPKVRPQKSEKDTVEPDSHQPEPAYPHLEFVEELQSDKSKRGLWVSSDGLRIYWELNDDLGKIHWASRLSAKDQFSKSEFLLVGRHPSLSDDERTIIFTINEKLHFATRSTRDRQFSQTQIIGELQHMDHVKTPSLTADGLRLVWFNVPAADRPKRFWLSSRALSTDPWSPPREIAFDPAVNSSSLSWPQYLNDGLTLLCNDESDNGRHRFVILRRNAVNTPFRDPVFIEPLGIEGIFGRAPRYVAVTDELYFLTTRSRQIRIVPNALDNFHEESEIYRLTGFSRTLDPALVQSIRGGAAPNAVALDDPVKNSPSAATRSPAPIPTVTVRTVPNDIGIPQIPPNDPGAKSLTRADGNSWLAADMKPLKNWSLDAGTLTNLRPGPDLISRESYRDFDLSLEFLLPKGGNSGVYLRGRYEVQLIDDTSGVDLKNACGSIWGQLPISKRAYSGPLQWNRLQTRLMGNKVTVVLNGQVVIHSQELHGITAGALDNKEGDPGPLVLQCRSGVKFRKIFVKPVTGDGEQQGFDAAVSGKLFETVFNGRDLTGWHGKSRPPDVNVMKTEIGRKAQQDSDDAAVRQAWKVQDGVIVGRGTHANLATIQDYQDFELMLEYKIEPNSDGGVFLRGCPQVQIWDPAKNEVGSGGLYNNRQHPKDPLMNADKPAGQWNSMQIRMIGPRVWVTLNGELVTDGVEMESQYELGGKLVPDRGPIELQSYSGAVAYRNIRLRDLSASNR